MKTKWNKIKFILTPKEFKSIFKGLDFYFPITNSRVAIDYEITDKTSIFAAYELFYNKVISGIEWKKDDWKLNFHASITDNPKHIVYKDFQVFENQLVANYKLPILVKPVINIAPFSLDIDHKNRLSVQYFDKTSNSNIGIEFSYPKNFEVDSEWRSTENFTTFQMYLALVDSLKKISKKAKIKRNNKIAKPNFWISQSCIADINNSIPLKNNQMVLF